MPPLIVVCGRKASRVVCAKHLAIGRRSDAVVPTKWCVEPVTYAAITSRSEREEPFDRILWPRRVCRMELLVW